MARPAAAAPHRSRDVPFRFWRDAGVANAALLPLRFGLAVALWVYALCLAFSHVLLLRLAPSVADGYFAASCRVSSAVFLRVLGFDVVVAGLDRAAACRGRFGTRYVVVANHVAVYDPWALMAAVGPLAFVARRSLFDFPVVGAILRALDAVGVDRRARRPADASGAASRPPSDARGAIADRLDAESGAAPPKWPLLVFPEGATTNGSGAIAFKTGAFAPLKPVLPVCLRYEAASGFDLSYTDNQTSAAGVLRHFLRVLLERGKTVTITVLPHATPERGADAAAFAAAARAQILGALAPGVDFADWDNARMRQAWYGDEASKVD